MLGLLGVSALSSLGGLADSALSFGGSLFGAYSAKQASIYASDMQKRINDDNIMFQRETNETNWKRQQQLNAQNRAWYLEDDKRDYERFLENRSYQTDLQNSAHQREVEDLRAAGLNPILSANSGAAAAVPALSSSTSPQAQMSADVAPHADASGFSSAGQLRAQIGRSIQEGLKEGLFGRMVKNYIDGMNTELAVEKTQNNSALVDAQIENMKKRHELELSKFAEDVNVHRENSKQFSERLKHEFSLLYKKYGYDSLLQHQSELNDSWRREDEYAFKSRLLKQQNEATSAIEQKRLQESILHNRNMENIMKVLGVGNIVKDLIKLKNGGN